MGSFFKGATDSTVARKELVAYLNTAESGSPVWTAIGWHCTDSALSIEIDTDTEKDILGNTFTNASAAEISQDFDPLPIHTGTTSLANTLQEKLHNLWMAQDFTKFSNAFDALIVYMYAGTTESTVKHYDAHHFPACTIEMGDFGGSGEDPLSMPFTLHYGGTVEIGSATIDEDTGEVTFTKNTSVISNEVPEVVTNPAE
jgi:hypothetical protein